MNEAGKLEVYKKKLDGICTENGLTYRFVTKGYPIYMEISPLEGMDDQVSMLESADDDMVNSPDAKLVLSMRDGDLVYRMGGLLNLTEAQLSKLKNLFRNMHRLYCEMFFRDVTERGLLKGEYTPPSPETDTNAPTTEPLEEYDEEEDETEPPEFPEGMMEDEDGAR